MKNAMYNFQKKYTRWRALFPGTFSLWADVQTGYHWVYRAAHILSNEEKLKGAQVRQRYERLLAEMADVSASSEALTTMLTTFRKVTASYWSGLFHCYDMPDLPRTKL